MKYLEFSIKHPIFASVITKLWRTEIWEQTHKENRELSVKLWRALISPHLKSLVI